MMARAIGVYCSAPSPNFKAMGIIPMIVASEVIRIGRNRTRHAVMMASVTGNPCSSSLCAKSTIRMLLESAIHTSISTPISDMTFSVVWVKGKMINTPTKPMGIASMISTGSTKDRN